MGRARFQGTVPQLEKMYRSNMFTVAEVVHWYMARIARYNGIYRAAAEPGPAGSAWLQRRVRTRQQRRVGDNFQRGPLWGVPIVTKANTSIKGLITRTDGRATWFPGHELIAPKDATIVTKLRAAGAVIIGQTNMPDFARE